MIKPSHAVAISVGCLAVAALTMCMSRPTNLAHGVSVRSTIRSPMMVRNLGGGISPRASPGCSRTAVHAVAPAGIPGTNVERTFIAIKPDGVQRRHIGEIIRRFENKGFKLVAMKLMRPTKEQAEGHYDSLRSKPFFGDLADYFSSGPICAMVWEGKNVIATGRQMLGATNPAESMPGTIRGDLCIEVGRNVCHGSDGPESAQKEINYWFTPEEVVDWGCADAGWIYEEPPTPSL